MSSPALPISTPRVEPLEDRRLLSITPAVVPAPVGSLSGKVVFTSGGHGFAASGNLWNTGRGLTNGMVEDLGNQDQLLPYADYLLRAGAMVVPMRPVGYQPIEVVLDNTSPSVTWSGTWSNSTNPIYYGGAGDAVSYRYASVGSNETAVATYTPNLPADGFYPVYSWVYDSSNRSNQLYRINHSGGSQEIRVDHRKVGKGWVYLGTYHFNAGTAGNVQISNLGDGSGGSVVIADAIRFGNGMGDIDRGSGVSGKPREDEASLYWLERMVGQGTSFSSFRTSSDDESANVGAPPRFAAHMFNGSFGDAVYLGWHSNASGGTARGTVGLTNADGGTGATPNQTAWADLVAREITKDLLALGSPPLEAAWYDRLNYVYDAPTFDYGEISSTATGNEFDATIIELAFHDNATDATLMRDPKVRDAAGRAAYQATVKYFNQFGSAPVTMAPGAPTAPRTSTDALGNLTLSWTAPLSNVWNGDAPSGYHVEVSRDGHGFGRLATLVGAATNSLVIPADQLDANTYYFRVVSYNAGGTSPASPVVAARSRGPGGPRVLVVNGFTRLDKSQNPRQTTALSYDPPATGSPVTFDRVRARFSNSFEYVAAVGAAIDAYTALPVGLDSVQKSHVASGAVNLDQYDAVIWLAGEQSSADGTFRGNEQTAVSNYLNAGGRLFVSGSEIGYDLVGKANGSSFFTSTLKSGYVGDDANTYAATGVAGSIFAGLSIGFDNGAKFYDVDYPDRLSAGSGASLAMKYVGGTGDGAAVQWSGGRARVVNVGFPFETITSNSTRIAIMSRVLDFFQLLIPGDMNNDGVVNNQDIAGFTLGLTDPSSFQTTFGYAPTLRGDTNGDGVFNNQDIASFVSLLTGARPSSETASPAPALPETVSPAPTLPRAPKATRNVPTTHPLPTPRDLPSTRAVLVQRDLSTPRALPSTRAVFVQRDLSMPRDPTRITSQLFVADASPQTWQFAAPDGS